jgi:hypothetical protein
MIRRRSSGPSLIGRAAQTAARTAIIAGTATAVAGKVAGRQHNPGATGPEPDAPAGLSDAAMEQLKKLAELHAAGILTEDEFATQKARILS